MTDWQPISSAPKDGTEILAWDGMKRMVVRFKTDTDGRAWWELYADEHSSYTVVTILTLWQALPAVPTP